MLIIAPLTTFIGKNTQLKRKILASKIIDIAYCGISQNRVVDVQ
jgi:hypothetical protein